MFLVTGASGNVGREVTNELSKRGKKVRVFTRNADKFNSLRDQVEIATGDMAQPETFQKAASGVEGIFLMNGALDGGVFRQLVSAAKAQGVQKIIFLSSLFASIPGSKIGTLHKDKEDAIREAGLTGVSLRAGGFMTNTYQWIGPIRAENMVPNPLGTGRIANIAPEDIAAVAVEELTSPSASEQVLELTGGSLLTIPEQVSILAKMLNKEIRCVDVPVDMAVQGAVRGGAPAQLANEIRESFSLIRDGKVEIVTGTVAKVLGRAPMHFEEWAKKHAAKFA